ncbi:50S ribosomal protein L11 methyltransferase [Hirschia baltica]|uniref:Ribosomal protein L11 methyltransferase n=1 Tax=Hirschia baltica (strain ATCC 49814 / DSM 5838 / IFAM 1418) TaxID=582402 RepID=C6XMH1_HIRBI|nr:50S ribosomal protein L11 methyltransferase [Hirschia baltica]ACT58114.1 ribosomal L11 methyltransferase [Hirschia baltica ATCC 49814]
MYKVSAICDRATAERISDVLADMDPSPAGAVSTEEATRVSWRIDAFCHDEESVQACISIIESEGEGLSAAHEKLDDKDWVAESLKGLPAVEAGPYYVAGAHELTRLAGGRIPVWIEAGPAFGTGHHGTTKGCLEALADVAKKRKLGKVLDIGTGSAVLAIAAMKSGASMAVASDIDPESIRIAKINAENNKMGRNLHLLVATGANNAFIRNQGKYDTVMANILARPLVSLSSDINKLTKDGGYIILSGLLNHQEPQVKAAFAGRNLALVDRRRLGAWSTLVFKKPLKQKTKKRPARDPWMDDNLFDPAEYFGI